MQDVGLPYMTDDRHAPDTFFLVAEADWRLYREHCVADREWMEEVDDFSRNFLLGDKKKVDNLPKAAPSAPVQPAYKKPETLDEEGPAAWLGAASPPVPGGAAASSSEGAGPPRPDRLGSPAPEADEPGEEETKKPSFYGWTKASRHEAREAYVTRDLRDLIQIANKAHRYHQRDDVVWYSWSGKGKSKNKPTYGSTLIGVSKEGAQKLLACMVNDKKPMHFDLWIRDRLYEKAHDLKGCYVYPAVGGFDEHISGCDPTGAGPQGVRESLWDQKNQVGGVRITKKNKDHTERLIRAFVEKKGHGDEGVAVEFGDDEDTSLVWKTLRPPTHYWQGDNMWTELLTRKGWLKQNGWLELPSSLTAPPGSGDWRALEAEPDERPWNRDSKQFSPISRVAEHLVCLAWLDADRPMLTKRQKTEYRLNLIMYKKRTFVKDPWKAA